MFKITPPLLIVSIFLLTAATSYAQKWQPGYFYDVKGNKETGLIRLKGSGKSPIKGEGFIEFKDDGKADPIRLSASDLRSFVVGRDSFVVAAAPRTGAWSDNELDFVKVVLDEDLKLYVFKGGSGGGGIHPELGLGVGGGFGGGGGGFGGGVGGGISIPIGGGGGGHNKTSYYFGANTAGMKELTPMNFVDVMSEIMGDEPDLVDQIRDNKYNLNNIDKLIANFNNLQAQHNSAGK